MRRSRRTVRFAPRVESLPRILPLAGPDAADVHELPPIEDIFAPEPAEEEEILVDFVDSLPAFDPLGPAPPALEGGRPPFVPLPDAPLGPAGPA